MKVLLERGVRKVYATARNPGTFDGLVALDPERVVPIELDVNNDAQRRAAAEQASDVTWLINNAAYHLPVAGDAKPLDWDKNPYKVGTVKFSLSDEFDHVFHRSVVALEFIQFVKNGVRAAGTKNEHGENVFCERRQ